VLLALDQRIQNIRSSPRFHKVLLRIGLVAPGTPK